MFTKSVSCYTDQVYADMYVLSVHTKNQGLNSDKLRPLITTTHTKIMEIQAFFLFVVRYGYAFHCVGDVQM